MTQTLGIFCHADIQSQREDAYLALTLPLGATVAFRFSADRAPEELCLAAQGESPATVFLYAPEAWGKQRPARAIRDVRIKSVHEHPASGLMQIVCEMGRFVHVPTQSILPEPGVGWAGAGESVEVIWAERVVALAAGFPPRVFYHFELHDRKGVRVPPQSTRSADSWCYALRAGRDYTLHLALCKPSAMQADLVLCATGRAEVAPGLLRMGDVVMDDQRCRIRLQDKNKPGWVAIQAAAAGHGDIPRQTFRLEPRRLLGVFS